MKFSLEETVILATLIVLAPFWVPGAVCVYYWNDLKSTGRGSNAILLPSVAPGRSIFNSTRTASQEGGATDGHGAQ